MIRRESIAFASSTLPEFRAAGLYENGNVYVALGTPLRFMRYYAHEVGHHLGYNLSFRDGHVLTPAQVLKTALPVGKKEARLLHSLLRHGDHPVRNKHSRHSYVHKLGPSLHFANLALNVFTKGKFNPNELGDIILHAGMSANQMNSQMSRVIERGIPVTVTQDTDGRLVISDTRDGRNTELPSIGTEHACLTLWENTVRLVEPEYIIPRYQYQSGSYKRAQRIIQYMYEHSDRYQVPSTIDIEF